MPYNVVAALICSAILLLLSGIHIFWAIRGAGDFSGVVPEFEGRPTMNPGRGATLLVAAALLAAAFCAAAAAGFVAEFRSVSLWGLRAVALVFLLRAIGDFRMLGFFKKVRHTRFARNDTLFYSPLCAMISLLAIVGSLP
ncbi:MAG: DUF3995 domain-containing protein [Leptospirales bacterium]|nr:DUF3995 domain-containing protein [Leptospirales bacterium]